MQHLFISLHEQVTDIREDDSLLLEFQKDFHNKKKFLKISMMI